MSKPEIKVIPTSMTGQSIMEIHCEGDGRFVPTVSQQLPTHIAEWIKESCNQNLRGPANPNAKAKVTEGALEVSATHLMEFDGQIYHIVERGPLSGPREVTVISVAGGRTVQTHTDRWLNLERVFQESRCR